MLDDWFSPAASRFAPGPPSGDRRSRRDRAWLAEDEDAGALHRQRRQMGIPLAPVFGTAAVLAEFLGGLALIFGLFTRYAAFFFGCVMAVAVFKVHLHNGFLSNAKWIRVSPRPARRLRLPAPERRGPGLARPDVREEEVGPGVDASTRDSARGRPSAAEATSTFAFQIST